METRTWSSSGRRSPKGQTDDNWHTLLHFRDFVVCLVPPNKAQTQIFFSGWRVGPSDWQPTTTTHQRALTFVQRLALWTHSWKHVTQTNLKTFWSTFYLLPSAPAGDGQQQSIGAEVGSLPSGPEGFCWSGNVLDGFVGLHSVRLLYN